MDNVEEAYVERKNLVGIIPVAGHDKRDFNMPWPDCMMPIASGYSMLESSVVECAWAGCKSIWIVVNDDFARIIRKKIGDWVSDPVYNDRKFDPKPNESRRRIPVYYVPVPLKHRDKIDSLSWSVIHGALTSFKLTNNLSKWVIPGKYYVSFPYSYVSPFQLREHRKEISGPKNVYFTSNGMGVKEGLMTSFTFMKDDWLEFRRVVRTSTGLRVPGSPFEEKHLLPPEERWNGRWFQPEKVFAPLKDEELIKIPVEEFFSIGSWEEYIDFIAASRNLLIKRPSKSVLIGTKYNRVAEDRE